MSVTVPCVMYMYYFVVAYLGDDFPNAASLLEAVLELQAERERATGGSQYIRPDISSLSSATSMPEGW